MWINTKEFSLIDVKNSSFNQALRVLKDIFVITA